MRVEAALAVDRLDAGADVQPVVVLLDALVRGERLAVAELPLAFAALALGAVVGAGGHVRHGASGSRPCAASVCGGSTRRRGGRYGRGTSGRLDRGRCSRRCRSTWRRATRRSRRADGVDGPGLRSSVDAVTAPGCHLGGNGSTADRIVGVGSPARLPWAGCPPPRSESTSTCRSARRGAATATSTPTRPRSWPGPARPRTGGWRRCTGSCHSLGRSSGRGRSTRCSSAAGRRRCSGRSGSARCSAPSGRPSDWRPAPR